MTRGSEAVVAEGLIRVRVSAADAHYGGGLVDGAHVLELFGDAVTEVLIRHDGDEGLMRSYTETEFLVPVRAGDYLEVRAELVRTGNTSRTVRCTAHKLIELVDPSGSAARVLGERVLVARAVAVAVVPRARRSPRP